MYDIREELMRKMVTDLRKEQAIFEVMSDEEYYYSDYGIRRRQRNQTCSNVVYMHCLFPGNPKNILGIYFHKKDIAVAAPQSFDKFDTDKTIERTMKGTFGNPYCEFRVIRKDLDVLYEDTKKLILELLEYAYKNQLYHI